MFKKLFLLSVSLFLLAGCGSAPAPLPTKTPAPTATKIPTATVTPLPETRIA
jgi:uncharacterized lipoprotein YajG